MKHFVKTADPFSCVSAVIASDVWSAPSISSALIVTSQIACSVQMRITSSGAKFAKKTIATIAATRHSKMEALIVKVVEGCCYQESLKRMKLNKERSRC